MRQLNVYPECNVDTNLVGHILGMHVKHKSTCNEVVKAVNRATNFAIGIIDADKRMATMDAGFKRYISKGEPDGNTVHLTMYIHDDGKRFIFTVKPAMDKFIFDAANEQGVNMAKAGFADTLDGFKKETKRIQAACDPKLRRLFALIKDYPELKCLRNTLKYLMFKQYDTDVDTAKKFFAGTIGTQDLGEIMTMK